MNGQKQEFHKRSNEIHSTKVHSQGEEDRSFHKLNFLQAFVLSRWCFFNELCTINYINNELNFFHGKIVMLSAGFQLLNLQQERRHKKINITSAKSSTRFFKSPAVCLTKDHILISHAYQSNNRKFYKVKIHFKWLRRTKIDIYIKHNKYTFSYSSPKSFATVILVSPNSCVSKSGPLKI